MCLQLMKEGKEMEGEKKQKNTIPVAGIARGRGGGGNGALYRHCQISEAYSPICEMRRCTVA
jgi:hypothetical protein